MQIPSVSPTHRKDAFNCPFCRAYAHQEWFSLGIGESSRNYPGAFKGYVDNYEVSICSRCNRTALWVGKGLVFPPLSPAPSPATDMPETVKADYFEAMSVVSKSPRAACALLRLALQKLMVALGEKGENLNDDIGRLVAKGLPVKVQMALDSVRVIGNEAVHPGLIDLKDDANMANATFRLVNTIVEVMVTQPKEIEEVYSKLPESKREAITKRDGKPG